MAAFGQELIVRLPVGRFTVAGLFLLTVGCHATMSGARQDVRNIVAYQENLYRQSPARIHIPQVDQYLNALSRIVLTSASEIKRQDEKKRPSEVLHVYDRFNVYLQHEPQPNAGTHGDDFAHITTTLLLLVESPEELVAVLCHEFAHIYYGHSVKRRFRKRQEMDKTTALAALAGGLAGAAGMGMELPLAVIRSRNQWLSSYEPFDRNDEFEADDYGLSIYLNLGLNPERYDDFWERILATYGEGSSTTHPPTSERIRRLEARIKAMGTQTGAQPKNYLDEAQLREAQRLVAIRLIDLSEVEALYAQSAVNAYLVQQGVKVFAMDACGPFHADPATCERTLALAVQRHLRH